MTLKPHRETAGAYGSPLRRCAVAALRWAVFGVHTQQELCQCPRCILPRLNATDGVQSVRRTARNFASVWRERPRSLASPCSNRAGTSSRSDDRPQSTRNCSATLVLVSGGEVVQQGRHVQATGQRTDIRHLPLLPGATMLRPPGLCQCRDAKEDCPHLVSANAWSHGSCSRSRSQSGPAAHRVADRMGTQFPALPARLFVWPRRCKGALASAPTLRGDPHAAATCRCHWSGDESEKGAALHGQARRSQSYGGQREGSRPARFTLP